MSVWELLTLQREHSPALAVINPDNGFRFLAKLWVWPSYAQPVLFGVYLNDDKKGRIIGGESQARQWADSLKLAVD